MKVEEKRGEERKINESKWFLWGGKDYKIRERKSNRADTRRGKNNE